MHLIRCLGLNDFYRQASTIKHRLTCTTVLGRISRYVVYRITWYLGERAANVYEVEYKGGQPSKFVYGPKFTMSTTVESIEPLEKVACG